MHKSVYISKKGLKNIDITSVKRTANMKECKVMQFADTQMIYDPNASSKWINKLASKFLNQSIIGACIIYGPNITPQLIVAKYRDLQTKPSWSFFARQISLDDKQRLLDESKARERKIRAENRLQERRIAAKQAVEFEILDDDDITELFEELEINYIGKFVR